MTRAEFETLCTASHVRVSGVLCKVMSVVRKPVDGLRVVPVEECDHPDQVRGTWSYTVCDFVAPGPQPD